MEKARTHFKELLSILVQIASLQTSFVKINQIIQVTSWRVNALEFIVLPKFKDVLNYIDEELEEQETEEKIVMKKFSSKARETKKKQSWVSGKTLWLTTAFKALFFIKKKKAEFCFK